MTRNKATKSIADFAYLLVTFDLPEGAKECLYAFDSEEHRARYCERYSASEIIPRWREVPAEEATNFKEVTHVGVDYQGAYLKGHDWHDLLHGANGDSA